MNSSFSTKLPSLQLAIDSTSLGEFKTCPRRYYYSIVRGYSPRLESVHLTWGLLIHSAIEHYYHLKFAGTSHEEALLSTVHLALKKTWDSELGRPWTSDHPTKNRLTLIRSIVWYLDKFGPADPVETLRWDTGCPMVEVSFRFDSSYVSSSTQEPFVICGHLDRIGSFHDEPWIVDFKSTEQTINQTWFSKFTPHNQFTIYTLAGQVIAQQSVSGVIVDACQTTVNFSRFERQIVPRTKFQLEEWHSNLSHWLRSMERCAVKNEWPQNDKSCDMYGGCPFRVVCSAPSQESRELLLEGKFKKRIWDPLQVRGDI